MLDESYAEFSRLIHTEVNANRVPVNGTIEITNRCPLTCQHCYNNLPMADGDARRRELSTEEHLRLIDEIADMGCLWLLYSGGEIFARHDFLDIYKHAKERGILVTLFTNGVLINERIADFLAEWPPFTIEITLYGRTPETYEALTGIPGSFAKCMRGIDLLMERGLPLKLKTVAVTINKHEVIAMRQFAESLGLEFKFDPMINPRIDCSASPLAVRLRPEEIVAFDAADPERVNEWRRLARDFAPPLHVEGETPQLYDCGGGVNSFAVDPYGEMSICVLSHFDTYNIRNGSFRDGWSTFLHKVRTRETTRLTKCTRCALKSMCGMCPATGELENGDPEAPGDFLCSVAHLRATSFGIEVPEHGDCEYCPGGERHELMAELHARVPKVDIFEPALLPAAREASGCGSGACGSCSIQH